MCFDVLIKVKGYILSVIVSFFFCKKVIIEIYILNKVNGEFENINRSFVDGVV